MWLTRREDAGGIGRGGRGGGCFGASERVPVRLRTSERLRRNSRVNGIVRSSQSPRTRDEVASQGSVAAGVVVDGVNVCVMVMVAVVVVVVEVVVAALLGASRRAVAGFGNEIG